MKVYYRVKNIPGTTNTIPYNYNISTAIEGALQLGLECISYFNVKDIYDDYEKGDIVLDGIDQVNYCLSKFNIEPTEFNYPDILHKYLGRKIWKDTINHIASNEELWSKGYFVKPIKEKVFTGKIISSIKDLIGCGSCYENYEVLVSEPLDIVYECRGFIYYDELKDLRPYKGNYKYMKYMDTNLIQSAMEDWKNWENRPNSCSLDFGVVRKIVDNKEIFETILVEGNLPYSLGTYGFFGVAYIRLISAYISQVCGIDDELNFGDFNV